MFGEAYEREANRSEQAPGGGYNHPNVLNSDTSLALMKLFPSIKLLRRRPGQARASPSERCSAESLISPARRRSLVEGFARRSSCSLPVFALFPHFTFSALLF